jgi:histidinol-phosphate aminotransferase
MVLPRPHIQGLHRFPPDIESHKPYLRLDKNERVIDFPEEIVNRFHQLFDVCAVMSYPEIEPLYRKLAIHIGVPRNHLLLTSGSDLAIKTVFETYVAPGDNVLLHLPSYAMYEVYCKMFQANFKMVSFNRHLKLNIDSFVDAITSEVRVVALENPNGFTGTVLSNSEILAIAKKAHRCQAILIIDEAYFFFTGESVQSLYEEFDNIVIVRSFSKDIGVAGLRGGYLLSNPKNIEFLYRVKPMYEITAATVAFCMAVLEFPSYLEQYIADLKRGMNYLRESLEGMGLVTGGGNGNFLLIHLGDKYDIIKVIKGLKESDVLVRRPFEAESMKDWLRVGIGNVAQMERFVSIFRETLGESRLMQ